MAGPEPSPRRPGGSLKYRLPLLMGGLLAVSVAVFAWIAYREVERAFLEASRERVQNVARQLAALLGQSLQPRLEEVRRLAGRPSVRALLSSREAPALARARDEIGTFLKTSPQTLAVDVWTANGERILAVPGVPAAGTPLPADVLATTRPTGVGFSPLHGHADDVITYDVVGAVVPEDVASALPVGGAPAPIGYVVIRRRASTPGAAKAVEQLIGGGLSVEFGARRDGVWTDLSRAIPPPPAPALATPGVAAYADATGTDRLGAAAGMSGSPWLVWVSMTREAALGRARSFVQRVLLIGLGIVLAGAAVGWILAGRVTRPLLALTGAAEAMAAGDFSRRVPATEGHEVGRLGQAFNSMAAEVQEGYARLDARVRERTQELEVALHTLKETQEALVRREKLAMLGQLASGVGHELRNPLGVMTNAVYYLELVQPDAPEEVREYHGILRSQIGLAERIVSDLLDFARIRPPQRQEISLARLVDEQLARLGKVDGLSIVRDVPEGLPSVEIDAVQVGQIVLNLLLNAAQAMEETGGVLTVRGRVAEDGVALDVTDSGPGVPPELREKVFEALFTTKARGIGLGLAVSRGLAAANGGGLTLANHEGPGATFTLVLPAVSSQVPS